MANATEKEAPSKEEKQKTETLEERLARKKKEVLSQTFDPRKRYMFELAVKNPERELPVIDMITRRPTPHQEFTPYRNIVLTSQIIFDGQRRMIRYYDGCDTIFVEDQPKDKEVIDTFIKQSAKRRFVDGKFGIYGDERMLLIYLNMCSWNGESEFRTRAADIVFLPSNADKKADDQSKEIDKMEEALGLAKNATEAKMRMHAHYLNIPTTDWDSGNELTEKEIRSAYRKYAIEHSKEFVESFGNKAIEIRYYISKALETGLISNKFNPNKATWKSSNTEICDISGLKSNDAIGEKLFEFSQLEEGQDFVIQLKALFNGK